MAEYNASAEYNPDENSDVEGYIYGPNTLNDATVTNNENIPNWTNNFTDITIEPFTQRSGPCLPEKNENAYNYFNLLLKNKNI